MTYTGLITFTASAIQITDATSGVTSPTAWPANAFATEILIEPLRSNTHIMSVGVSTVTIDGSGTGVISELAQPGAATVILDRWQKHAHGSDHNVDATVYYVRGTTSEKCKVTIYAM